MIGGTAGRFGAPNTIPIRLRAVNGYQHRVNDIVYCPPLVKVEDEEPSAVVYFGGDVQVINIFFYILLLLLPCSQELVYEPGKPGLKMSIFLIHRSM